MESWDEAESGASEAESDKIQQKRKRKPLVLNAKRAKQQKIPGEKSKKSELFKPPTIEELSNLKVTENLFNNNLFRLQIEELIKEVAIKQKRRKALQVWLDSLAASLQQLPEHSFTLSSQKSKKAPQCPYETDQDLSVILGKPEGFECFGLYENNALPGPHLEACVNVTMPKACFHVKDFLNNRYWVKRFYYLNYLRKHLQAHKKELIFSDSNALLPILLLQPTDDEKCTVKIYVTPPDGCFKASRCLPNLNNVKKNVFQANVQDLEVLKAAPTVLYNSALAHDVTLKDNIAFVKSVLSDQKNVQEAIKLLLIWLKQRELDVGFGGFGSTLVLYLVTYLLMKKKVNQLMSSYQVAKNFFAFISSGEWEAKPISLSEVSSEHLQIFQSQFKLVFLDETGCYNLAAFLNFEVYRRVQTESALALQHLNEGRMDSFQLLFLTKLPFALQYDAVIDLTEALPMTDQFEVTDIERAVNIGFDAFLPLKQMHQLLGKGLGRRALHIVPQILVDYSKGVTRALFGVALNAEAAFNFIEMGPALSDVARAEEFRQFWGYLASDRRFRDSTAHVAVYFKTATIRGKRSIVKRIIKYLLNEKHQMKFRLYYDEFEEFIANKLISGPYPMGTNEEGSLKAIALADELGQKLRSVQMSLSITGIQGTSDTFSYCEVFPPVAARCQSAGKRQPAKENSLVLDAVKQQVPRYLQPLELVLQLEHSSKWPSDLQAIRHLKTSFHLEIAKMLKEKHNILCNATTEYLEAFYQGLVFRYRLYVPKEIVMMKKQTTEAGSTAYVDNAESQEYEKMLGILPKVNASLKGIQMQSPSFGPATALIKRWLRCHMIDNSHLPDTVVNLLNVSLYVNRTAFPSASSTPQLAFLRFLKFISEFQWELQPLIVNFNDELTGENIASLEEKVQEKRAQVQPLYIITPCDQGQSVFTTSSPTREVLNRVQQLAEASLKLIVDRISCRATFELKSLFVPNTDGYDLLIQLNASLNPRAHEQLDNADCDRIMLKKYQRRESEKIPIAGFNPVDLYLRTLRENYGEMASFFHDSHGGSKIGVLWNPSIGEDKEFKVGNIRGSRLENGRLLFNKDALIDDFYILGKDLVSWIDSK
ncbi:hypothetical protein HUJ04_013403 [Dendroctonus ponderosae]|uniref:Nucleolar protein 6 n=1 Tax=Dendroctonus ponderosae TaxID=77166 RepID=A0AAR5Q301_DENPD|nr:hypothetical protein HUJ04_013403 [Dendroctonus ponderosae]